MTLTDVFDEQRATFAAVGAPSLEERRALLSELLGMVLRNRRHLVEALREDFGSRSAHETLLAEVVGSAHSIRYARRHLRSWMRPRRRSTSIWFLPGSNRVIPQPKGVVGVVSPWNYPVNLTVGPITAALAAGNRVMVKMSELTPTTASLLSRLVSEHFSPDQIFVTGGDVAVAREFVSLPFDHLLFTGSTAVGREVMRAAAENLTPVTLELGGKSPVIIDDGYPITQAATRITWGKLVNAGQTCIAPDYVLVPADREEEFSAAAIQAARRFYPTLAGNEGCTAIIDDGHYARLESLLDDARAEGATVEVAADPKESVVERKFPLAVVRGVNDSMRVTKEEIFGPVLPVIGYRSLDEAIAYVNTRPRPLALYLFSQDEEHQSQVLRSTTSGGVTINDTLLHYLQDDLPFGGVGRSGTGAYHGREGFDTFSHHKGVFTQRDIGGHTGAEMLYPPYGRVAGLLLRLMRRF